MSVCHFCHESVPLEIPWRFFLIDGPLDPRVDRQNPEDDRSGEDLIHWPFLPALRRRLVIGSNDQHEPRVLVQTVGAGQLPAILGSTVRCMAIRRAGEPDCQPE